MYTLPGAFLLAGVERVLSRRGVRRPVVELAVLGVGAAVGAGVLALLFPRAFVIDSRIVGTLYGLATAGCFVTFQRVLGSRYREQS